MKIVKMFLLFLVILIAVVFIFRNTIVKAAVTFGVKQSTGLQSGIGDLNINLGETYIDINNLHVRNPEGFPEAAMIDAPEIYVNYELSPLFQGQVHLTEVRLHLRELLIVRNAQGKLNIQAVQERLQSKEAEEQQEEAAEPPEEQAEAPAVQIDLLKLKIERAIYKDYTVGTDPLVQRFDLKIDENFENITDPKAIVALIISKALRNSTIARLTNLNPEEFLQSNLFDAVTLTNQMATNLTTKATEGVSQTVTGTTTAVRDKADALVGQLQGAVKLPSFGSKKSEGE